MRGDVISGESEVVGKGMVVDGSHELWITS